MILVNLRMPVQDDDARLWGRLRKDVLLDVHPVFLEIEGAHPADVDVQVEVQWLQLFEHQIVAHGHGQLAAPVDRMMIKREDSRNRVGGGLPSSSAAEHQREVVLEKVQIESHLVVHKERAGRSPIIWLEVLETEKVPLACLPASGPYPIGTIHGPAFAATAPHTARRCLLGVVEAEHLHLLEHLVLLESAFACGTLVFREAVDGRWSHQVSHSMLEEQWVTVYW